MKMVKCCYYFVESLTWSKGIRHSRNFGLDGWISKSWWRGFYFSENGRADYLFSLNWSKYFDCSHND